MGRRLRSWGAQFTVLSLLRPWALRRRRQLGSHGLLGLLVALFLIVLAVWPAGGKWADSAPVSLRGDGTSWIVEATIDGRAQGQFLLDTGASYCVIAPDLARELSLLPTGRYATVATANGSVRAPIVLVRSLDLGGGVHAQDVEAIVHDAAPKLDGLLGLTFLNRYRYAVDPKRHLLHLE
jgi:clan AA aspartic protease (TIGR02281 family)